MSKYDSLWAYVAAQPGPVLKLSYDEIESYGGTAVDHSFLKYKKELGEYGWHVGKISMKTSTIEFIKNSSEEE